MIIDLPDFYFKAVTFMMADRQFVLMKLSGQDFKVWVVVVAGKFPQLLQGSWHRNDLITGTVKSRHPATRQIFWSILTSTEELKFKFVFHRWVLDSPDTNYRKLAGSV